MTENRARFIEFVALSLFLGVFIVILIHPSDRDPVHCYRDREIGWFDFGDTEYRMTDLEYKEFCQK